jgi:membrane protein DedA with SNARE-associated domain
MEVVVALIAGAAMLYAVGWVFHRTVFRSAQSRTDTPSS